MNFLCKIKFQKVDRATSQIFGNFLSFQNPYQLTLLLFLKLLGKIKKTSTDRTTFLSEDEEDKITETLEKIKNTDEYSYQNRKSHKALEGTAEDLEDDDVVMPDQLLIRDSDEDNELNSATDLTISQQVELQKAKKAKNAGKHGKVDDGMFYASAHETDNMDGEEATDIERHRSTPTDNLFDYYKLNKPTEIGNGEDEEEDQRFSNKFNYTPIDLSELGHDEKFRPTDKTLIVKNTLEKDSKSSLVNNESFEVVEDDEESGPHHRSNRSETGADIDGAKAKPFDSILAKFERKSSMDNSSTDGETTTGKTTQRTRSEDPRQKPTPTKLPKSKFDIYSKIQEGKTSPTNESTGSSPGSGKKPSSSHKDKTRETDASTAGKGRESRGSDSEDSKSSKSPQRRSFSELPKSNRKSPQSSDSDGFSSQFKRPEKSSDSNSVRDLTSVFESKKSSDSTRNSRSPPTTGGSSKSRGDRSKQQEQESSSRKSPTLNKPGKSSGGSKKIGAGSKSPENQEAVNEMISKLKEDNAAATEKIKKLNDQIYNIFDKNTPANASDESSSANSSDAGQGSSSKKSHTAGSKDSADKSKQPKKLDKSFLNQYESQTSSSTDKPVSGSKTSAAAAGDKSPKSSVSHIPRSKNSYSSSGSDKEDPKASSSETKTKPKKLVFGGSKEAENSKTPKEVGNGKRSQSTLSDATAPGSGQTIGPNKFKLQEVDIESRLREQKELADEIIKEDSRIKKLSQKFESDDSDSKPKRSFSVTKKSTGDVNSSKDVKTDDSSSGPTETIIKAADKLHNRFQGIKGSSSSSSESDNEKSKLKAPSSRTKKSTVEGDDSSSQKPGESKASKDSSNRRQLASPTHQRHSSLLSSDREDLPSVLGQDKTRSKSSNHDVQSKVKKLSERFSNNSDTTGSEAEQKPLDCGVPPSALDRSTKADANKPKKLAKNKFEQYEADSKQEEPLSPGSNRSASTPGGSQYYNKNKGTSKAGNDSSDSQSIQDGRSRLRKVEKPTETGSNETKVDENMTPSKLRRTFGSDADNQAKSGKDSAAAGSKSTTRASPTMGRRASKEDEATSDDSVYQGRRIYGRDGPDDIASKPRHAYGDDDMDVSPRRRTNRAGKDIETPKSPDSASKPGSPGSSGRKTYGKDSSPFPRSKLDREDEEPEPNGATRTPSGNHADGGSKSKGISHLLDKFESSGPSGSETAPTSRNVSQIRRSSDDKTNTTAGKKTIDSKESAGASKSGDGSKDSVDLFRDKLRNRRDPRDAVDESEPKTTATTDKTKARTRSNDVSNLLNEYERKIRPNNNNANQSGETSDDSVFQKLASRSGPGKKSPTLDDVFSSTKSKYSSDKTKDSQDSKSHQQQSVPRRTKSSKSRSPPTHRGEDDEGNRSSELDAGVYVRKTSQPGRNSVSRFRNTDDDTTDYDVPKLRKKSNYEAGEFAPVKFSDQSSIGSESRVYPRAVSREFFEDTDTDGAVEKKTRPRAKRPSSVGYRDNGIGVQLEGKKWI